MVMRKTRRERRPQIDTAASYERAWGRARYFELGGKTLSRAQFHRERFEADELRQLYETDRAAFAAMAKPGERHPLWWEFDSVEPRDTSMAEAEQLDRLGLLTSAEIEALTVEAVEQDRELHKAPWHIGLPFRRPWSYWRFVAPAPRDASAFESKQLAKMGVLTSVEREILAEPDRATGRRGAPICRNRTRFFYLDSEERKLLGLVHKHDAKIEAALAIRMSNLSWAH